MRRFRRLESIAPVFKVSIRFTDSCRLGIYNTNKLTDHAFGIVCQLVLQ